MNKKSLRLLVSNNWKKYHTPGMPNYCRRKKNAVFISPANSREHETAKLLICYELRVIKHDFLTEAVENSSGDRVDVVDLVTGLHYEVETSKKRAERFKERKNVVVVKLWEDKPVKNYVEEYF